MLIKHSLGSFQLPEYLRNCDLFASNMAIIDRAILSAENESIKRATEKRQKDEDDEEDET